MILFHLRAKTQKLQRQKMFCFLLLICLQTSALCRSKFLQAFFFSGCHQFYLEPSSLSGYFKTELLSLSHKALITRRAKRGARRTMPESSLFCRNGAGLANAHEGVSTFRNCQSDILFKKLFIWLCPVLAALQHVRSQFADQGLIPCSLHCKVDSQPLIRQGSP